jgi:hypothetical protein
MEKAMFNSLKCVKRLEQAGVSREQAEVHIQIMSELMESNLVTSEQFREGMLLQRAEFKEDTASLRAEIKEDIASLRAELKEDTASLRAEFKDLCHRFDQLEARMTIKLGTMMSVWAGIMIGVMKLM